MIPEGMILIAESGSTKTDWRVPEKGIAFRTDGINADIQPVERILSLFNLAKEQLDTFQPEGLVFYGASLANPANRDLIRELLINVFNCNKISVHHDILAAARAACGTEEGIVGILGTGSNSCYFDGEEIKRQIGGHGYILGDEGSAADLGKALLNAVLNDRIPEEYRKKFLWFTNETPLETRKRIYSSERPNIELANLSRFIGEFSDQAFFSEILVDRFRTFLKTTIKEYDRFAELPVHFIGSVAWFYRKSLHLACKHEEISTGKILRNPIDELEIYHQKRGVI